jgi:hypothetical protein
LLPTKPDPSSYEYSYLLANGNSAQNTPSIFIPAVVSTISLMDDAPTRELLDKLKMFFLAITSRSKK